MVRFATYRPTPEVVGTTTGVGPWLDASLRLGTPNALPLTLPTLEPGDTYRQNGMITPAGVIDTEIIDFGPYGYRPALTYISTPQTIYVPMQFHDYNGAGDGLYNYVLEITPT